MSRPRPVRMPTKYRLYVARSKADGSAIALVEARDEDQAAVRVAYVVGRLGISDWQEVEIQLAQACEPRVPTFLDAFFGPQHAQGPLH